MAAGRMRAPQKIRIVHCDPELARVRIQRLEQTVLPKIKEYKILQITHGLGPLTRQIALENSATKITDGNWQSLFPQSIREIVDAGYSSQTLPIASLNRGITDGHLCRSRETHIFRHCLDYAAVSDQTIETGARLILVVNPVWLY